MEIELVPVHVHRALAYLQLVADNGQSPSASSLDTFAVRRAPRLASRQFVVEAFQQGIARALSSPTPADSVTSYLKAVGWAEVENDKVTITLLGQATLQGLNTLLAEEPDEPDVTDVALAPDEPLTWVHLTRTLSKAGAGMLVDAYFKADFLPWLLDTTSIERVLVSSRHSKATQDIADLSVALGTLPGATGKLEVRSTTSKELHDRCLVHADGTVQLLGASITGVGKNLTAVIEPHNTIQRGIQRALRAALD